MTENTQIETPLKQPLGIALLSIPFFIAGLYNIFAGFTNASIEIQDIYMYGFSQLPDFYQLIVVVYVVIALITISVGAGQLTTVYGFWTRKYWSQKSGKTLPIFAILTSIFQYLLLTNLGYSGISLIFPVANIVAAIITIWYLRLDHVKTWLNDNKVYHIEATIRKKCNNCQTDILAKDVSMCPYCGSADIIDFDSYQIEPQK